MKFLLRAFIPSGLREGVHNNLDRMWLEFKVLFLKPSWSSSSNYPTYPTKLYVTHFYQKHRLIKFNDIDGSIVYRVNYFPTERKINLTIGQSVDYRPTPNDLWWIKPVIAILEKEYNDKIESILIGKDVV